MPYDRRVTPELQATLDNLPDRPGVYLFRDARRSVVYVGKAQSLRHRVRSYWQSKGSGEPQRIRSAIDRVREVEWTLTDTVSEALLLENNLIKRYQPRFNVRLKDDKSYPFIKVTLADDFPRIERTRRLVQDGSRYFGPYASASSVDAAMDLIRRIFPFRTCTVDIHEGERALPRPCLLYDIKRCQGPCVEAIDRAAYRRDIDQVMLFLEGRQEVVARALRREMQAASNRLEFERAATLRDQVRAIERTMESQKMAAFARTQQDVLGLARSGAEAAVQLFMVRGGKMVGRDVFVLANVSEAPDDEVLGAFLKQYYANAGSVPPRVLLAALPPDAADLEAYLSERRGGPVHLRVPRRGEKRDLVELAERNAADALARQQARWLADHGKTLAALEELSDALGLPAPPLRIECYDISNFQGSDTVGSMVVFAEGRPKTSDYPRFRVRAVERPNDFASHQEVLRRRFRHLRPEGVAAGVRNAGVAAAVRDGGVPGAVRDGGARGPVAPDEPGAPDARVREPVARDEPGGQDARSGGPVEPDRWPTPDLLVIDGGKGQVSAAMEVLHDLGLHDLPLVGLAKEREELFLPERSDPVLLPATSPALYLVQRLRDEAHRFAITYHRSLRATRQTRSAFDELPGVGPRRRRALLRAFGSLKRVREASVDELAAVPGIGRGLAERIKEALEA